MTEKLSPFHFGVLVYMSQIGIVIFTLPHALADSFGTNGWLFLLVCFLFSTFNIYLITAVYRMGKGRSVFSILEQSIPKPVLVPLYLVLAGVWLIFGCMIGKKYILLFQMIAFPTTNPMQFKLALDVMLFFLLIKGIYTISKAATLFFWMTVWMNLLLVVFIPEFRLVRLTPFLFKEGHDMLKGGLDIFGAFLGYELSILLFPYLDQKRKQMPAIYAGNTAITLTYLGISLICFGFFGMAQLKKLLFPLLDLLSYIHFPFIERLENLLYGFFLFLILLTVVMYWWAALQPLKRIYKRADNPWFIFVMIAVSYVVSFIPKSLDQVNAWISNLGYAVTAIAFALPMLLILLLLIPHQEEEANA